MLMVNTATDSVHKTENMNYITAGNIMPEPAESSCAWLLNQISYYLTFNKGLKLFSPQSLGWCTEQFWLVSTSTPWMLEKTEQHWSMVINIMKPCMKELVPDWGRLIRLRQLVVSTQGMRVVSSQLLKPSWVSAAHDNLLHATSHSCHAPPCHLWSVLWHQGHYQCWREHGGDLDKDKSKRKKKEPKCKYDVREKFSAGQDRVWWVPVTTRPPSSLQ